jgi:hypothetical protein
MAQFYTPAGYSGSAQLTASTGLVIEQSGLWRFNQAGYVDGATFGLSLTHPSPLSGEELVLTARDWTIPVVGNQLTEYADPETSTIYPADTCRIEITGRWQVTRQVNPNSYNSFGVAHTGRTVTDLGERSMDPWLLSYVSLPVTLRIQGAAVEGGAIDTFSSREFFCRVTETAASDNSNRQFQSNTTVQPIFAYTYSKSWQIAL